MVHDPLIAKMLYGLIASSTFSIFIAAAAGGLRTKANELTNRQLAGWLVYSLILIVWCIGMIWYWLNLLSQT